MKILSDFSKLSYIKKLNESGRGMVEMLGVIAVIGVLTIIGMVGYRFAMEKYQANDIINSVNTRIRDTWYNYQLKDLPVLDGEELGEYETRTDTDFPISVRALSSRMFEVSVDDLPFEVCRRVLQVNLQGPIFIYTRGENEARHMYNGQNATELCGDEDTRSIIVYAVSLDEYYDGSGGGTGVAGDNAPERENHYCLEEGDCPFTCQKCDAGSYTCHSTCPPSTPYCCDNGCHKCCTNANCPSGYICNETNHRCEKAPKKCEVGEFRSKNGACIKCDSPLNTKINPKQVHPGDLQDGESLCISCRNAVKNGYPRRVQTNPKDGATYCSYACSSGVSYQNYAGTCVTCINNYGDPTYPTGEISNDAESKAQCEACQMQWYASSGTSGKAVCKASGKCSNEQFTANGQNCIDCSNTSRHYINVRDYTAGSGGEEEVNKFKTACTSVCNALPDYKDSKGKWAKRWLRSDGYCYLACDETLKKKFQNDAGTCYDFDYNARVDVGGNAQIRALCTASGRYLYPGTNWCYPTCAQPSDETDDEKAACNNPGSSDYTTKCRRMLQKVDGACVTCASMAGTQQFHIWNSQHARDLCKACGRTVRGEYCVTGCSQPDPESEGAKTCDNPNISDYSKCTKKAQNTNGTCYTCGTAGAFYVGSDQTLIDLCKACGRSVFNAYCVKPCLQPDETSEGHTACSSDDPETYKKCTRLGKDSSGTCQPCVTSDSYYVGTNSELVNLCKACGRTVDSGGYCVRKVACGVGTFSKSDRKCESCDKGGYVQIVSSDTTCESQCMYDPENSKYSETGTVQKRHKVKYNNNYYCLQKKCSETQYQDINGNCYNCSELVRRNLSTSADNLATICKTCPEPHKREMIGTWCYKSECTDANGKKGFHDSNGDCRACDTETAYNFHTSEKWKNDCEACGADVRFKWGAQCLKATLGVRGICHADQFKDTSAYCWDCTTAGAKATSAEECKKCPNRRYENGNCIFGLCTDGTAAIMPDGSCKLCSQVTPGTEIGSSYEAQTLCDSCDERRPITSGNGSSKKYLCGEECGGGSFTGLSGKCVLCSSESVTSIGNDEVSIEQCMDCDRIPVTNDGENWKCSEAIEAGEKKYININGAAVSCEKSGEELPSASIVGSMAASAAANLCEACGGVVNKTDEGRVFCD